MNNNENQAASNQHLHISLPEEWVIYRLHEFGKVYTGNTPPTEDQENYGNEFLFVSPGDLNGQKYINSSDKMLSAKGFSLSRRIPEGSILFTCIGSTIGKIGIAGSELSTNQQINAVVVNNDNYNEFIYYELEKESKKIRLLAGEQAVPILNKSEFENIRLLRPPLKEQTAIATLLSTWDNAIELNTKLLQAKQQRKKWLMQVLLTGKKRLPGFEGEWRGKRLGDVFSHIKNVNDGADCHSIMTISSKFGFIAQEDKFDRVIAGESLKKYTQLKQNDFAYNKGNSKSYPMGCIYQLEQKESALVPFVYICFRSNKDIIAHFYKHWFLAHGLDAQLNRIITSGARGDGLLNVSTDDFFKLIVPWPCKEEQYAIAQVLTVANKEISDLYSIIQMFQNQKKGLMQLLLTGKKRLINPE